MISSIPMIIIMVRVVKLVLGLVDRYTMHVTEDQPGINYQSVYTAGIFPYKASH